MNDEERARYKADYRRQFEPGFRDRVVQIERELRDSGRRMTRLEVLDLCEQRIPALSRMFEVLMPESEKAAAEEISLRMEVLREVIADMRRPLVN